MIEIVPIQGVEGHKAQLGDICLFRIHRRHAAVEIRWFLHHDNVLQTQPMCDWSDSLRQLEWRAESPGAYRLEVQWRDENGSGWQELAFQAGRSFSAKPAKASRGRKGRFWAPNEYESKGIARYEADLFARLPGLLHPGSVVYDIGANIGLFSIPFSKGVGPRGQVICFEPNPICVHFLKANLEHNGCRNCRIAPVALAEREMSVPFTLNFGNSLLGLTGISGFYSQKVGQAITVEGRALDELRQTFRLPAPDLVKMDVEGAEAAVVRGMAETLESARPQLLLEVHGPAVAFEMAQVLDPLGYSYEEAASGKIYTGSDDLVDDLERGPVVRQLICSA